MTIHVFGIRHHGPGCARSLETALEQLQPDLVVIEGPADADGVLAIASHPEMQPPVALLIYEQNNPRKAVYFPFAEFSPEWRAMQWSFLNQVPVRFMDLPQTLQMAEVSTVEEDKQPSLFDAEPTTSGEEQVEADPGATEPKEQDNLSTESFEQDKTTPLREDPLAQLAQAAGYQDFELWWEQQVEQRADITGLFEAILQTMQAVREQTEVTTERDLLREAHMRQTLRAAVKDGAQRIAVVCGAWHAPVLVEDAIANRVKGIRKTEDQKLLRGLPKVKTTATWIPWTNSRLSLRSGYGAGVNSPGWYTHLWRAPQEPAVGWIATAARLLREKDIDASSANVIEAVRLADALGAMRGLRSVGLSELTDAILTVLCNGEPAPLQLIRNKLEIGDVLGQVAENAPTVPLAKDLAALQKRLRLKVSAEHRLIDLDLRKENDLEKSHLLHRLQILGIHWGQLQQSGGRASTFHEIWQLGWQPEFAIAIVEANVWGNTVEGAALACLNEHGEQVNELNEVTRLLELALLADLGDASTALLGKLQTLSAIAADVRHLLDASLPLARIARYGDVRGTEATQVLPTLLGMLERAFVGLVAACSALDDEAAERMLKSMSTVQQALELLQLEPLRETWQDRLVDMLAANVHPLIRGWCCRLLLDQQSLSTELLSEFASRELSRANPPIEAAAWLTGLLRGSGLVLLYQEPLWLVVNEWLVGLQEETFVEMLPLIRRAFADFSPPERRQMGEKVKHLSKQETNLTAITRERVAIPLNEDRARKVLPLLAEILGGRR